MILTYHPLYMHTGAFYRHGGGVLDDVVGRGLM
jgi:hypothetical protein